MLLLLDTIRKSYKEDQLAPLDLTLKDQIQGYSDFEAE